MDIIKLYKKMVLPWRRRAETAETQVKHLSNLVGRLSHELKEELDRR